MISGIIEYMRKKYVGVDLFNGRLRAFEIKEDTFVDKKIEEIIPGILDDQGYDSYWHNLNDMKELLTYVSKNIKSLSRPALFIAHPFENSRTEDRRFLFKAALKSGWSVVNRIDNYLCSAVGSGMEVDECKRKLYLYSQANITYIGLLFAGGAFNVKCLKKGFAELTEEDVKDNIGEILSEVSSNLPEGFNNMKVSKKDLKEVTAGWNLEIQKKIYLSVPYELRDKFNHYIGDYELVYLAYEDCILDGLRKVIIGFIGKTKRR